MAEIGTDPRMREALRVAFRRYTMRKSDPCSGVP